MPDTRYAGLWVPDTMGGCVAPRVGRLEAAADVLTDVVIDDLGHEIGLQNAS